MKHIIWTDDYSFVEDLAKELATEDTGDENDYENYIDNAYDLNNSYLDDEKINLGNIKGNFLLIGDLGLWNGRVSGYKEKYDNNSLGELLYTECDTCTWYVEDGEFKFEGHHHDGTNYITYRMLKTEVDTDSYEYEDFLDTLVSGEMTDELLNKFTEPLGKKVNEVYGWVD